MSVIYIYIHIYICITVSCYQMTAPPRLSGQDVAALPAEVAQAHAAGRTVLWPAHPRWFVADRYSIIMCIYIYMVYNIYYVYIC